MEPSTERRLRVIAGGKMDRRGTTALERRALADLAFWSGCDPAQPLRCCARCFERWARARLMEHWRGEHYWAELDNDDFGVLRRPFHRDRILIADVVARLAMGSENLAVITWALESGRPFEDVVAILTVLDVNTHRVPLFAWLTPTSRCVRDRPPRA